MVDKRDPRALRRRNLALAGLIAAFVVILFFVSMTKFGS